jgi:hypothetical protein
MKECGGGRGAESPNNRLGKWKANWHLDPCRRHNDRFRHVTSPYHIRRCSRATPGRDLLGDTPSCKGAKCPHR